MTINTTILSEPTPTASAPSRAARALRLPRSPKVITGLVILAVFAVIAIIGAWIAPYSPNLTNESWVQHVLVAGTGPGTNIKADYYPLPLAPSSAHWLGTTIFAQDVWSQLLVSNSGHGCGRAARGSDLHGALDHRRSHCGLPRRRRRRGAVVARQRLSRDPRAAVADRARRLRAGRGHEHLPRQPDHRDHRMGVQLPGAEGANPLVAQSGLR